MKAAQLLLTLFDPMDYIAHEILQARILEWIAIPFSRAGDLPNPGIEPRSPALVVDSLLAEPPGKPKNTGVGSVFLLSQCIPDPVIELGSPALQVDSLPAELPGKPLRAISKR